MNAQTKTGIRKASPSKSVASKETSGKAKVGARTERKVCLLVLGMHRSGTSALTRALSVMGAKLPANLLGAAEGNETGHWEPARIVAYHDRLLSEANSNWADWRPLDLKQLTLKQREIAQQDLVDLIDEEYGNAPLIVIKDPRICRFAPFFADAVEQAGYQVVPVFAYRNPLEVVQSLMKRDSILPQGFSDADAALLWLSHNLLSESFLRKHPGVLVSYSDLLSDWEQVISSIDKAIPGGFPKSVAEARSEMDEFLDKGLRNNFRKDFEVALDPTLGGWVSEAYQSLQKLNQNLTSKDTRNRIDAIRDEFNRAIPIMSALSRRAVSASATTDIQTKEIAKQLEEMTAAHSQLQIDFESELEKHRQELTKASERSSAFEIRARDAEVSEQSMAAAFESQSNALKDYEKLITNLKSSLGMVSGDNRDLDEYVKERAAELEQARTELVSAKELVGELQSALENQSTRLNNHEALLAQSRELLGILPGDSRNLREILSDRLTVLHQKSAELDNALEQMRLFEGEIAKQKSIAKEMEQSFRKAEMGWGEAVQHARNIGQDLEGRNQELQTSLKMLADAHFDYTNSTSWKLTKPVRSVGRVARQLRRAAGLAPSAIKVGGGLLPSVGKAVRIAATEGVAGVRKRLDFVQRIDEIHQPIVPVLKNAPLVSIIVPNYNHAEYLEKRLDTIYAQDYPNFEVILLDDCSSDNSRAILERYQVKYSTITRYEPNEQNSGSGYKQWAKGLKLARGELVWIAESDDWSAPRFLSALVPHFSDEALTIAYSNSSFTNASGDKEIWTTDTYLSDLDKDLWKQEFKKSGHQLAANGWSVKNLIPNVSSAVFRHPGTDNDLLNGEWSKMRICGDWLLYLNLAKGGRVAYLPAKLNYYRVHEGSTAKSTFSKDVYYSEHASVARFVIENFEVSLSFLQGQDYNLRTHWLRNREDFSEEKFRNCYDPVRIRSGINSRRLKILMCGYAFAAGGGETFPIFMANMLKQRGYPVTFLSFEQEPREPGVRSLLRPDIPVVCDYRNLPTIIEEFGIDIIHSHHAWVDNTILDLIGRSSRAKTVISTHGMYESLEAPAKDRIVKRVASDCDAIVYTAEKNLEPFRTLGLEGSPKLTRISNALPEVPIHPFERNSLGIPEEAFVLCLVSRAIPGKGWQEGIEAVELARNTSGRDIHLVLVGEGVEYDRLKPLHQNGHVHFVGFKKNLRDFYAASDAGFLPTRFPGESYPLTLIDCLAVGKPMIATRLGEIPNMLDANGQCAGAMFSLDDWKIPVEDVAALISRYASDSELYREAKEHVAVAYRKFDPAVMTRAYESVYAKVAKAGLIE